VTPVPPRSAASLRLRIYRAGSWLGAREVLGLVVRLLGLLVTLRVLGPGQYGQYAGALAAIVFLTFVAQGGLENYLTRREEPFDDVAFDRASTYLLVSSTGVALAGLAISLGAGEVLAKGMSVPVFQVLLIAIPLNVLWAPAQARLDKALRFRAVARLELAGDVILHGASVALVLAGLGVWALVIAYVAWQLWLLVVSHLLVRHLPRPRWSGPAALDMARFGLPFAGAQGLSAAEGLLNPLIVGPVAGTAGVGTVAVALRILDTLGFVLRAGMRLAVVAFATAQRDRARLARGLEEAMLVQVLVLGSLLVALGAALELLLVPLFGAEWEAVRTVVPVLAVASLADAASSAQIAYLQSFGRSGAVVRMYAVKLAAVSVAALLLVPAMGIAGFALAGALSSVAYLVAHRAVRVDVAYDPRPTALWVVALAPLVLLGVLPGTWRLAAAAPLLAVLAVPLARAAVGRVLATGRRLALGAD
jgi:PST family polysaccharide transporter